MAPSAEKLAESAVFFTVTSLPRVMKVHAHVRNRNVEGRAGPWEAWNVRRCYILFPGAGKGLKTHDVQRPNTATRPASSGAERVDSPPRAPEVDLSLLDPILAARPTGGRRAPLLPRSPR